MTADVSNHGHGREDIFDKLASEFREHIMHRDHPDDTRDDIPAIPTTQTPAAGPVNLQTTLTEGDPVSLLDTIEADLAEAKAKLEGLDEAALGKFKAVMTNPETSLILDDLASVAQIAGIPVGVISQIGAGIKALASVYAPAAAPAQ